MCGTIRLDSIAAAARVMSNGFVVVAVSGTEHRPRRARAAAGGVGTPQSGQTMMELSYGFAINPHLRIAPSLHYVMHPDQFNAPGRLQDLPNAWVAGLRFDLSL